MSVDTGKETLEFQTEARQILHLMTHSLYSNKEIFLRELISNASDACDKLRFEALEDSALLADDPDLAIRITADKDGGTLTITDNGIGMSREELIENLGTIARSGTAEFLQQMTGDQQHDARQAHGARQRPAGCERSKLAGTCGNRTHLGRDDAPDKGI